MKLTRLLLVLLALATGAFAQENPAKLALAREVITAMKADKMFDAMLGQMKQMAVQSARIPPDATPEQKKKMEEFLNRVMDLSMESAKGIISQMDHIYADVYSEAELRATQTATEVTAARGDLETATRELRQTISELQAANVKAEAATKQAEKDSKRAREAELAAKDATARAVAAEKARTALAQQKADELQKRLSKISTTMK